jgi:hypothetical protein
MLLGGVTLLLGTGAGCGNVQFIDAPYAPRKIDVLYSAQEDVTVVRWRMAADKPDPDVRFEILDASNAWQPVDFAASVFAGGVTTCGDGKGTCAQLVLDGPYQPPPSAPTMLRSFSPGFGVAPGNAAQTASYDKMLTLQASFELGNAKLAIKLADAIGGDPVFTFPRPLQSAIWERRGVCVPGFPPPSTQFAPLANTALSQEWAAPATLSDDGRYCASVRAVKTDGQPGVDEPQALDTLPETTSGNHSYSPPTETTPFSYQIVLDLSIPVADRCQQSIAQIESTVASAFGSLSPVRALPTIDLSTMPDPVTGQPGTPCLQSATRALDAVGVAQAIKVAAASWPEQHQRAFLLYFNNLRAPLPATMTASFDLFYSAMSSPPPAGDLLAQIWAFGPPEMVASYNMWGQTQPWLSASDPNFEKDILDMDGTLIPLVSEVEDPTKPILILGDADLQRLAGGQIRLCQYTVSPATPGYGTVYPIEHDSQGDVVLISPSPLQWPVTVDDPPAYLVALPQVWAVPQSMFKPDSVQIHWEVCARYCDHPFTTPAGQYVAAGWLNNTVCQDGGA